MTKRRLYERRERHALVDILAAIAGGLVVQFSQHPSWFSGAAAIGIATVFIALDRRNVIDEEINQENDSVQDKAA